MRREFNLLEKLFSSHDATLMSYSYFVHSRKDILPLYLNKSDPRVSFFFMFDQI